MKDLRALTTGLLVLLLLVSHNLFLYCIQTLRIDKFEIKVWYNLELLVCIVPLIFMGNYNHKTVKENEFRKIACFALLVITLVIVLNNLSFLPLLPSPRLQMYCFNGISIGFILYALFFSDNNGNL